MLSCFLKGYFKNEEATASTIDSEGWLKTGDLCYIDSEGFVFVVDRLKELIKCNGYQVTKYNQLLSLNISLSKNAKLGSLGNG